MGRVEKSFYLFKSSFRPGACPLFYDGTETCLDRYFSGFDSGCHDTGITVGMLRQYHYELRQGFAGYEPGSVPQST